MAMDAKEAAARLDKNQYRDEGTHEFFQNMKANGLVAIFGASDDLIELRGAVFDEFGAGETLLFSPKGLLRNECGDEHCLYFEAATIDAPRVTANFDSDGFTFTYSTKIPHETFDIYEGDEPYCRGIVISLDGLA